MGLCVLKFGEFRVSGFRCLDFRVWVFGCWSLSFAVLGVLMEPESGF